MYIYIYIYVHRERERERDRMLRVHDKGSTCTNMLSSGLQSLVAHPCPS